MASVECTQVRLLVDLWEFAYLVHFRETNEELKMSSGNVEYQWKYSPCEEGKGEVKRGEGLIKEDKKTIKHLLWNPLGPFDVSREVIIPQKDQVCVLEVFFGFRV